MKKIFLSLLMSVALMLGYSQTKEVNDPNAEVRNVKDFHGIKVMDAIDLYLSPSDNEVVAVSASKVEYRNKIRTEVDNGILKIWFDDKWTRGDRKLKAYISFKTLDKLHASGASDVRVTGTIKSDDLDIDLSGASDFEGAIQANSLVVGLSGASDMTVTGSASSLKVDASGASEFRGYDFEADNCSAKASGASDIKVTVNKELSAHASGASGVYYKGNGVIMNIKSNGASSISKKG
jgi:Putative auto-transporter adhesin, head GIN domain